MPIIVKCILGIVAIIGTVIMLVDDLRNGRWK